MKMFRHMFYRLRSIDRHKQHNVGETYASSESYSLIFITDHAAEDSGISAACML